MPERRIYLLSPQEHPPETIAVAFAKTSRSPLSFQEIADELSDESSAAFHEKWVVGYGHASVAEHAVLHIAIENVSRMAIECIESNRLASYTEKSTRYQTWDADAFVTPPELDGHPLRTLFQDTAAGLFETYTASLAPVRALVQEQFPRRADETEAAWERRIRSRYVDVCRFLLPAASLANVGMTVNARALEAAIRKMLSHPLAEVRQIGEQVKAAAQEEVPTLVKYADAVPYQMETARAFRTMPQPPAAPAPRGDFCHLIDYDADGEDKVLAAALYRFGEMPYAQALTYVRVLPDDTRAQLAERLLGALAQHDVPLRELEYSAYTFDLLMDQGAYFEFKRHRMMTQTSQALTTRLGYATPRLLVEAGFGENYVRAMEAAATAYEQLAAIDPHVAAYIVPNGFNRRVLARFNLREAYHFCQLRAARNAHFSIRRIALKMSATLSRIHPLLTRYMHLPEGDTWRQIEADHLV